MRRTLRHLSCYNFITTLSGEFEIPEADMPFPRTPLMHSSVSVGRKSRGGGQEISLTLVSHIVRGVLKQDNNGVGREVPQQ